MKAAVIREHGGLDQIQVEDIAPPRARDFGVVIDLRAAALNHLDIWIRRGRPGLELSMPHVLGSDGMGVVAEVGPMVKSVKPGQEVIINPALSCGVCEYCLRGQQSECLSFSIVGMGCPGTYAERVLVPETNVHLAPGHLSPIEAAALPLAYLTAWRMLHSRARILPGETLLIHGIGGGVALAGLQLAELAGVEVIVTSSSEEKLDRARALGARHAINYRFEEDVAGAVRRLTHGRGVDVVFDTVGAETWPINFDAVRRGGRIVHCGVTTGAAAQVNLSALYWNQISVLGSTMGSNEDFRQLLNAVAAANLHPILDSVEPLARVREAMARMESGLQFGKIVLDITGDGGFERARAREEAFEHSAV